MKINYTNYAEIKIQKRGLSKAHVENALKNPDKIIDAKEGRKIAQKAAGKHLLRVVFEESGNAYKVITAYYSKTERYK